MARWTAGAKWAEGPAPDGQRATLLALTLSELLGHANTIIAASQRFGNAFGLELFESQLPEAKFKGKLRSGCRHQSARIAVRTLRRQAPNLTFTNAKPDLERHWNRNTLHANCNDQVQVSSSHSLFTASLGQPRRGSAC